MRWLALLALPLLTAAAPGITSGPDRRELREQPGVIQGGGWDLACLFSSATSNRCSDSRVVTTTRSTAVPCQGSDGTWGTAAINTACIAPGGVAGVESYGAVTNYVTNSTTPTAWTKSAGVTVSGNTVTDAATGFDGVYVTPSAAAGDWTISCYMQAGTLPNARLVIDSNGTGGGICPAVTLTGTSTRFSCTKTIGGTPTFLAARVYAGDENADTGTIVIDQCQTERASTPGRRCDSGGTATTCGADKHMVATTGWPTARGEVVIDYKPIAATSANERILLDGRDASNTQAFQLAVATSDQIAVRGTTTLASSVLTWTAGQTYRIRIVWSGANVTAYRDGVQVLSSAWSGALPAWAANARIGGYYVNDTPQANGTVSLVSIGDN